MTAFSYTNTKLPIRDSLVEANRKTWERLANAGNWWTGTERVALAAETRTAKDCAFCKTRKDALSPNAVEGTHDTNGETAGHLPPEAIDAVHRIVTDQGRLSEVWVKNLESAGISDGHYVELVGIVVSIVSIDAFHDALGIMLEPLPSPEPGEPSHYRPPGLVDADAYCLMASPSQIGPEERDIYPPIPYIPNVLRALSTVPDAVRSLMEQSSAYYLRDLEVADTTTAGGRAITRPQMEFIAGRVSLLNECFY